MIAVHAALAAGDLERARDEIRVIAKYQGARSGMIWHELSQSAPYLDWRGKYPYLFVHAELTYPYVSSVADYVRASNDREFLHEIWPSVQKAFQFGRTLIGNDGLPRIPEGKEGANEQNPLADELGMSASWISACADYAHLARLMQAVQEAAESEALAQRARASFARHYWDAQRNRPLEGYRRDGTPVEERTLGAIAAVTNHLLNVAQDSLILDEVASWRFQSDWGTRSIAVGEPGYDPSAYAYVSVWALGSADVAQAYWNHHRLEKAWEVWRALIPWSSLDSPGHMHEVLAGDTYHPQLESVPEQTWSSSAILSAAVHGLFGLEINAESGTVTLAPHLPADWDRAGIRNVRIRSSRLDFTIHQEIDGVSLHTKNTGESVHLEFEPETPLGVRSVQAEALGHNLSVRIEDNGQDEHAIVALDVPHGDSEIALRYGGGVAIVLPAPHPSLGEPSSGMKLTSCKLAGNVLQIDLDLIPGRHNTVQILTKRTIQTASGARVTLLGSDRDELTIKPTPGESGNYQHRDITVTLGR